MVIEIGAEVVCRSTGRHYKIIQITDSSIVLEQRLVKFKSEVNKDTFERDYRIEW
jgi:hypothetical protein